LLIFRVTKEEIVALWETYHKEKYCVAAVIEPDQYKLIKERWEKYPVFVIPGNQQLIEYENNKAETEN
jgi:hypothetical protein